MPNGTLHVKYRALRNVMKSSAEAELGALFHNAQVAEPIRTCLAKMGHLQSQTPLKPNNSTAIGIMTSFIQQKKIKSYGHTFLLGKR